LIPADELISTDAIALVRFGLRAPEDPRVIDRLLKVELPQGPGWRRKAGEVWRGQDFEARVLAP